MLQAIQTNLTEIELLVSELNDDDFYTRQEIISGSSIGQHVRHILEFYLCLIQNKDSGTISYDNRQRDVRLETDRALALDAIEEIKTFINAVKVDVSPLVLKANLSTNGTNEELLKTSLFRELAYVFEHSIHHQAIIKICIRQLKPEYLPVENFGVAPSTTRHQNKQLNYRASPTTHFHSSISGEEKG